MKLNNRLRAHAALRHAAMPNIMISAMCAPLKYSSWFFVWLQCSFSCNIRVCSWKRRPVSHLRIDLASSLPYVATVKSQREGQVCDCWSCYFSRGRSSGNQLHPIYWKASLYKKTCCGGQAGKKETRWDKTYPAGQNTANSRTTNTIKTKELQEH